MGRKPCCSKVGLLRGPWSPREDTLLINYILAHGEGHWRSLPKKAGLLRCGKSCRLRWMNYLRPDIKRGNITPDEDDLIIRLHSLLGNRWSLIAKRLPGRTDNEIKNYWNTHLGKRVQISQPNSKHAATNIKRIEKSKPKPSEKKQDNKLDINDHNPSTNPATEPKLHLPKASRVSPFSVISRSSSLDSIISGSLSSTGEGSKSGAYINNDSEGFDILSYSWSDINAGNATLISDKDQEFDYGFDAETFLDAAPAPVPPGVGDDDGIMFDDFFEEYKQLLKAENDPDPDPDPDPDESFLDFILI